MLAVIMLLGAGISAFIASNKNRNPLGWAALGFCFPLIGILVIACQTPLPAPSTKPQLPSSRAV